MRPIELRDSSDGANWTLTGTASAYGVSYAVNDWRGSYDETIAPGAFGAHLRGNPTVPLKIQHDPSSPILASTGRSGTMTLSETPDGLQVRASLAKDDPDVQGAVSKVRRGLLDRMSVGMAVDRDRWSDDRSRRTVSAARLGEISLVLMPANPEATASVRGARIEHGMEVRFSPSGIAIVGRQMSPDSTVPGYDGDGDEQTCPTCHGTGKNADGYGSCPNCAGSGFVPADDDEDGDGRAGKYSAAELQHMMRLGHALPNANGDPSYPIGDREDVRRAVRAVGRGSRSRSIRLHIMKNARRLNATDLIPDTWASDGSLKRSRSTPTVADYRVRAAVARSRVVEAEYRELTHRARKRRGPVEADWRDSLATANRLALTARLDGTRREARAAEKALEVEILAQALGL